MPLYKMGVIPYSRRDLLSLTKAGDAGSGPGKTVSMINNDIERLFQTPCGMHFE